MLSYNVADLLRSAPGSSERHDVAVPTLPIADGVELKVQRTTVSMVMPKGTFKSA